MKVSEDILYRFFCGKFLENVDVSKDQISYARARWVLSRYRIPGALRMPILDQMTGQGYVKRITQRQGLKIVANPILVRDNIIIEKFN
jgi:hypothetical protein